MADPFWLVREGSDIEIEVTVKTEDVTAGLTMVGYFKPKDAGESIDFIQDPLLQVAPNTLTIHSVTSEILNGLIEGDKYGVELVARAYLNDTEVELEYAVRQNGRVVPATIDGVIINGPINEEYQPYQLGKVAEEKIFEFFILPTKGEY